MGSRKKSNFFFPVFFLLRRLLIAASIVLIKNTPIAQLTLISLINIGYLVYLCKGRPYKSRKANLILVLQEGLATLVCSMFLVIKISSSSHRDFIGLMLITAILGVIVVVFIIELIGFVVHVLVKLMCRKRKQV